MAKALPANPLTAGLERLPVHPTTLVIFGATGDLARRKLLPALYNLAHEGALPERFHLVGSSRSQLADEDFRTQATDAVREFSRRPPDEAVLEALLASACYVSGSFDDPSVYERLEAVLVARDEEAGEPLDRCFYLSTAPSFFPVIVRELGASGLDDLEGAQARVVVEKPFGSDLAEARELNAQVLDVFREDQVFRIDHYLGKETVQNVLAFRFANAMFEPLWNRNYIDHVQITAAEDIGIGSRAGYYDASGALRDLIQNHMLQLLTLLCMEPPVSFSADEVRDEKVKVLRAIRPPGAGDAVHGQYTAGTMSGEAVPGYRDEEGVPDDSITET
ncbi:MAG TPA: glucose-6-phosphate dehydrogenase, partial [Solirubrobacteraceae bacterium]|nr:glucose-6-phosphate dehydrogenase [Solirubrobacteraceae bacterium]